ncbi:g9946 [Coccomyxa elongata]
MLNEAVPSDGAGADMENLSQELLTQLAQLGAFPGAVMPEQFAADQAAIAMMQAAGLPLADAKQASDAAVRSQQTGNSDDGGGLQDGGSSQKRKTAPLTEEERKKRRKEINRQSARRIRERKSNEMESLRQQVAHLQGQVQLLLRHAANLGKEKTDLMQRNMELTERCNMAAGENAELRARLPDGGASVAAAPAALPLPGALSIGPANAAAADSGTVLGHPVD